jgi:hypothetical protein
MAGYLSLNSLIQELSPFKFTTIDDILEMNQSEIRIACGGHVC